MTFLTSMLLSGMKLAYFFQDAAAPAEGQAGADFSVFGMIKRMNGVGLVVLIILLILSMYSIAIGVERLLTYNAAKNQSRQFAPKVAVALKGNRIDEAIAISDKHKKSHLAMVVNAGLQKFQNNDLGDLSG